MLTVVKYRGKLFYVIGASMTHTDNGYLTCVSVDDGSIYSFCKNDCYFKYFVDDKGHKLDLNFKRIKEKT